MCQDTFNPKLAPLSNEHVSQIIAVMPHHEDFAIQLQKVLTENLTPQVNLFVAFMALKELYDSGKNGIFEKFGRILYAPLSIVAKTANHEWTRFRPQPVEELHTSFLSFMMAKPNRLALNQLLGNYGLCFSQGHCCGILFGSEKDVKNYEQSDLFKMRNEMRSYAEAMAMPVVSCEFSDIPLINSDLGKVEMEFYKLYEGIFEQIKLPNKKDLVDDKKDTTWDKIINTIPMSLSLDQEKLQSPNI